MNKFKGLLANYLLENDLTVDMFSYELSKMSKVNSKTMYSFVCEWYKTRADPFDNSGMFRKQLKNICNILECTPNDLINYK